MWVTDEWTAIGAWSAVSYRQVDSSRSVISCGFPTSVQHSALGQLLHVLPTSVDWAIGAWYRRVFCNRSVISCVLPTSVDRAIGVWSAVGYNMRTLSANIKFICKSFRNKIWWAFHCRFEASTNTFLFPDNIPILYLYCRVVHVINGLIYTKKNIWHLAKMSYGVSTVGSTFDQCLLYNWWLSMRWIQGLINPWNMIFTEASEVNIVFHGLINLCIHRNWKSLTVLLYDIKLNLN